MTQLKQIGHRALLKQIEELPEPEFNKFFNSLPERVKLLCRSRMVDWKKVLPEYYDPKTKLAIK